MPLETGIYVSSLVDTNPLGADARSQGDDHIRLIKSALLDTFPNASKEFRQIDGYGVESASSGNIALTSEGRMIITTGTDDPELVLPASAPLGWCVGVRRGQTTGSPETVTIDAPTGESISTAGIKLVSASVELKLEGSYVWFHKSLSSTWYVTHSGADLEAFALTAPTLDSITNQLLATQSPGLIIGESKDLYFTPDPIPPGWLEADGSAVSRTTYADLFSAIGTTYGAGDGSTTFGLPDRSRHVLIGSGGTGTTTIGKDVGDLGGEEEHTQTVDELVSHVHSGTVGDIGRDPAHGSGAWYGGNTEDTDATGGGEAFNIMQPSIVVFSMIYAGA